MESFGTGEGFASDPVWQADRDAYELGAELGKWYFFDETYEWNGPFETEDEARRELKSYCERL